MPDATFDGAALEITLPALGSYDAKTELYSAWKEWIAQGDNAKYPRAFDTTGGDSLGAGKNIAPYFFCRNDLGWRIKMPPSDGNVFIEGNIFPRDANIELFIDNPGNDAFLRLEVSSQAIDVSSTQIKEMYQLMGLDQSNPATLSGDGTTSKTVQVGGMTVTFTPTSIART